ncbi:MAG: type II CAAX endopeptidase family protein, partial [Microthrixaceae bacterium]
MQFRQKGSPDHGLVQGWGLGDVAIGICASIFLSAVLGSLLLAVAGWESSTGTPIWGLALLQVPLWAGYLGAVFFAGSKGQGVVADFGLRMRSLDAPLGLALGVACQLVVLPLIYTPIFILTGTDANELSAPAEELAGRADGKASWLLFALLVGVLAPVVEELFYRGLFLRSLEKRRLPAWAAVLLSSFVFAGMHLQALQFPGLMVVGLVAGTLAVWTGRLGPAIWLHIG